MPKNGTVLGEGAGSPLELAISASSKKRALDDPEIDRPRLPHEVTPADKEASSQEDKRKLKKQKKKREKEVVRPHSQFIAIRSVF